MSLLKLLLSLWKRKIASVVDEDAGYTDHMVGQKNGPFFCGTAFCGHSTKAAARKCWKEKVYAVTILREKEKLFTESGQVKEAAETRNEINRYYPEQDPRNWPINRSSAVMHAEFVTLARREEAE